MLHFYVDNGLLFLLYKMCVFMYYLQLFIDKIA
jgi:hypothetical protein